MNEAESQDINQLVKTDKMPIAGLIGLAVISPLGFGLRFLYLKRMIFHVDEFASLLTIRMIQEKGTPILPSGAFYGAGLLYSYLGAGIATVFQFEEEVVRSLSLGLSVLTIPVAFLVAYKLFHNHWGSLLIAATLAIQPQAILWGGRARMYSQAQLLVFLIILVAWLSLVGNRDKLSAIAWVSLTVLAALLSHLVILIIWPGLLLAVATIYRLMYKPKLASWKDWRWLAILSVAIILMGLLGRQAGRFWYPGLFDDLTRLGQEKSTLATVEEAFSGLKLLKNLQAYFFDPDNILATLLALIGCIGLVVKTHRKTLDRPDYAALFIYIQLLMASLALYIFIPTSTRAIRHNFIVLLPFLMLAMVYGAITVAEFWWREYASKGRQAPRWLVPGFYTFIAMGLFVQFMPADNKLLMTSEPETYRYNEAFSLANQQMESGDRLMSVYPTAAYLYTGHLDYYAKQKLALYFPDPDTGQLVDAYTGAPYLSSVDELVQALNQPGRLWFVVDENRFIRRFDSEFSQQVLHQMTLVERIDNILIFVEKTRHWPMASTPAVQAGVDFSDQARLVGYSMQLVNTSLQLTLFWEPIEPVFNYKVFVHLRDRAGHMVAQADFLPYDGVIRMPQWRKHWQDDFVRTGTILNLPLETLNTTPEQYQLFIGLYAPELNSERVPVIDDVSGENAVILTDLKFQ